MSSDAYLQPIVDPVDAQLDIVAVHGLNPFNSKDHAEATWTAPNGKLWLKDFLPAQLPKARIFLFSYNANPAFKSSSEGVHQQANNLLVRLSLERDDAPTRPLYFICHSLGGLVVKRAIVQAQQSQAYEQLLQSLYGLVFFGTPHRGGNNAGLGDIAAGIARSILRTHKNDYLEALKKNSFFAEALRDDFRNRLNDFQIVTIYENRKTKGVVSVVDRQSAVLGLPDDRETVIGLDADHSTICTFGDEKSLDYRPVWQSIRRLVTRSMAKAQQEQELLSANAPRDNIAEPSATAEASDFTTLANLIVTCDYGLFSSVLQDVSITNGSYDSSSHDKSQQQTTHTLAYAHWLHECSGMLLCIAEELEYDINAMLAPVINKAKGTMCVIQHKCHSEHGSGMRGLTHLCLSLILNHLWHECAPDGSWNLDRLTEELQDLADQGIDLAVVREALAARAVPTQELFKQLSALVTVLSADDRSPLIVIEKAHLLEGKTAVRLYKLLHDHLKDHCRILLIGSENASLRRGFGSVPQVDKDTERQEFLQSLYFEDLHFRRERVQEAHPGTITWIFNHPEFQKWDREPSGILWIQGKPGSGKSVLAKALLQRSGWKKRWPANVNVFDWFYSARNHSRVRSDKSMFKSILYQVHQSSHDLFLNALPIYRSKVLYSKSGPRTVSWDIEDLSMLFECVVASGLNMVCVLDALDESEGLRGQTQNPVFTYIANLVVQDARSRMKLILLSRPTPSTKTSFKNFHVSSTPTKSNGQKRSQEEGFYEIVMEEENEKDIATLVDDRIRELESRLHPYTDDERQDRQTRPHDLLSVLKKYEASALADIRNYVVKNAKGVILWVALVFEALYKMCDDRKGGVSMKDLKQKLEELPPGLSGLYKRVVKELEAKESSVQDKARMILMLVSASSALRPIGLKALWDAIAAPKDPGTTLTEDEYQAACELPIRSWGEFCSILNEWCGPFLEVVQMRDGVQHTQFLSNTSKTDESTFQTATVQFLHQSVKEFFASYESSFLYFAEREAGRALRLLCLQHVQVQKRRFLNHFEASITSSVPSAHAQHVVPFFEHQYLLLYLLQAGRKYRGYRSLGYFIDRTIRPQENWLEWEQYDALEPSRPRTWTRSATFTQHMEAVCREVCRAGSLTATEWILRCLKVPATWRSLPSSRDILSPDENEASTIVPAALLRSGLSRDYADLVKAREILPILLLQVDDIRHLVTLADLKKEPACAQMIEHFFDEGSTSFHIISDVENDLEEESSDSIFQRALEHLRICREEDSVLQQETQSGSDMEERAIVDVKIATRRGSQPHSQRLTEGESW